MPLNPDFLGRALPPSAPYQVGIEKIREFADALGDANPAYREEAAARALGHPAVLAPPTFPIVMTMAIGRPLVHDPELGLDYSMVVHGEQRFRYTRPVYAGDVLVGRPQLTELRTIGRNESLTWEAAISTADGEPVVVVSTTLVSRGTAAPRGE